MIQLKYIDKTRSADSKYEIEYYKFSGLIKSMKLLSNQETADWGKKRQSRDGLRENRPLIFNLSDYMLNAKLNNRLTFYAIAFENDDFIFTDP